MSTRRGHKKSRHGCVQCKKRHIKCDETRPICGNCSIVQRDCSYVSTTAGFPPAVRLTSRSGSQRASSPTSAFPSQSPASSSSAVSPGTEIVVPALNSPPASLVQAELLYHFTQGKLDMIPPSFRDSVFTPSTIIERALTSDFLLNEVLAFSARHLAVSRPEQSEFYFYHAQQLQAHALALFTQQEIKPGQENCITLLFFSWLVGIHLLSDIATIEKEEHILNRFLYQMQLYRGVRTVMSGTWEFLLKSDIGDLMHDGRERADRAGTGLHTSEVKTLIVQSLGMDDSQKSACCNALESLQSVFDIYEKEGLENAKGESLMMTFTWPLIISPKLLDLIVKKRPEALIVLAYFSVLLHWCRQHWIFGPLGTRLLTGIGTTLGQGWERWLQWPEEMVGKD